MVDERLLEKRFYPIQIDSQWACSLRTTDPFSNLHHTTSKNAGEVVLGPTTIAVFLERMAG